jgi:hypothetical protein
VKSLSLLFMMKVMVWHFVSDSHKVMTALIVVLPSNCCCGVFSVHFSHHLCSWKICSGYRRHHPPLSSVDLYMPVVRWLIVEGQAEMKWNLLLTSFLAAWLRYHLCFLLAMSL